MLTEQQRKKSQSFDNERSLTSDEKVAKMLLEVAMPRGKSADYYEAMGDTIDTIASLGMSMKDLGHLLTLLPLFAILACEQLKKLDGKDVPQDNREELKSELEKIMDEEKKIMEEDEWIPKDLVM